MLGSLMHPADKGWVHLHPSKLNAQNVYWILPLLLGIVTKRQSLHVAIGSDEEFVYIITAYIPNTEEDLKTRR